jgi:predicted secreted protein with PEFG-CTERM motif
MGRYRRVIIPIFAVLFAISMISAISSQNNAYAQLTPGLAATVTASDGSDQISIDGYSGSNYSAVTVTVVAPNGNIAAIDQVSADGSGSFSTEIATGGSQWSQDGTYTIKIQAGQGGAIYNANFDVEISGGTTTDTSLSFDNTSVGQPILDVSTEESIGLSISADAVQGSTTITITGTSTSASEPVLIKVISPLGSVVSIDQISVNSDGTFTSIISTEGSLWSQDGVYTIDASQGTSSLFKSSVEVDIADGAVIPEFGTIVSLVLVVAIASIIVLSAKSRLSLTPRI